MNIQLTCLYCDYKWRKRIYSKESVKDVCCPRCQDKQIKIQDLNDSKIDYYAGSPPFPSDKFVILDYDTSY